MTAPREPSRNFFDEYTRGFDRTEFQRLFTRDTADAYHYFSRGLDLRALAQAPWYKRWPTHIRLFFVAFAMRLSPGRRVLYAFAVVAAVFGLLDLFDGFGTVTVFLFPISLDLYLPQWVEGTSWMVLAFLAIQLLVLMEVADRLSLKSDLEIARDIQIAMLPRGSKEAGDARVFGFTRPANTVGGDFYDILPLADGRLMVAVGDVAGKGSPAALLMALLLAMLRTLVDEGLQSVRLISRLNVQICRHSPGSRFITFFFGVYNPADGSLEYVNAGHLPPMVKRASGTIERLERGGMALGMFEHATYDAGHVTIGPGEMLVLYTDGITEAEDRSGQAFEDSGLEAVLARSTVQNDPEALAGAIIAAVEAHAGDVRLADDLTVAILGR
ncbi:MAG TPA: PP2C family protein-serine/threonine phosphatase [Vicinamibacterales bacterium]|jgi:serine phosphatase RsbU (regulator of sigma subunit)|nr:PP2C family protein-serine/threonine phosphatase [Vicinamibacterales bacterium]